MKQTLVIAEAGVNHNGDLDLAFQLVEAAAQVGADVVKFQTFCPEDLATDQANKAEYQKRSIGETENQLSMLKKLQLTTEQHYQLIDHCKSCRIEFLSTAFDPKSIDLLSCMDLKRWKIPSGEITNLPYLRKIASMKKPIILSTGMATLGEIEAAINLLEKEGVFRNQITVLHCTTEYPAPFNEVNLLAMKNLSSAFGVKVGYSDHTDGIAVSIAAVAMGAVVIEKHLTLDRKMEGPDHKASLDKQQFGDMVQGIRAIEQALGDGIKRPTMSELANLPVARKSIVASRAIKAGEQYSVDNITTKRPGNGLSPMLWDSLLATRASRNFAPNEQIEW